MIITEDEQKRIDSIASKIKVLRKKAGFTAYRAFADKYELEPKQVWRLEKGQNFTIATLIKILNIHSITLEDFFKDIE